MRLSPKSIILPACVFVGATNIEVPIVYEHTVGRNVASVDVSISGVFPEVLRVPINLGRIHVLRAPLDESDPHMSRLVNMTLTSYDNESWHTILRGNPSLSTNGQLTAELAIGTGSTFLNLYRSVALIQNATHPRSLYLRSSYDDFVNFCDTESHVSETFAVGSRGGWGEFSAHVGFVDQPMPPTSPSYFVKFPDHSDVTDGPISLSYEDFNRVRTRFIEIGAIPDPNVLFYSGSYAVFHNCTHIPDNVLDLSVNMYSYINRTLTATGRVFITGDEYIRHLSDTSTCTIKLSNDRRVSFVNPLKLPGLNVRIAEAPAGVNGFTIQFCDSSL
jgi:hypothetical protein